MDDFQPLHLLMLYKCSFVVWSILCCDASKKKKKNCFQFIDITVIV